MDSGTAAPDFDAVYLEHAPLIRRVLARRGVRQADLDDVLQEAFVTIHRLLPSFEGRASLETWLQSVTWRVASSYHRRSRGRVEVTAETSESAAPPPPPQPSNLHASLAEIDEEQRDLFALHEIGGFSISQLSELTGSARATVRQRLERARTALGRRIWKALTEPADATWLERLRPDATLCASGVRLREACSADVSITTVEDVVIAVWRGPSNVAGLELLMRVLNSVSADQERGFSYISVVEASSTAPDRQARQLMAWMAGKLGPRVVAAGWAVESRLMTSLVSSVVNTSCFLGGVPFNMRFFEGVPSVAAWVALHGKVPASELIRQVELTRARLPRLRQ